MQPATRVVSFNGAPIGQLIIAPDPTYEMDEIWTTSSVGFNHMAGALERSVSENHRLTRRMLQTQENERKSIARELHDEIGQCVSAIHADAAAIRNRGGETVRESAEAIVEVTVRIKDMVRSMLQRLRPPVLEALGLATALRELVAAFQQRSPQVDCTLRTSGDLMSLDAEIGIAVYRVVQECLTNITTHAGAHHVAIEVTLTADPSEAGAATLRVSIIDDGVGFLVSLPNGGLGLTGIRERVKVLGGTCSIESRPRPGTSVSIAIGLQLPVTIETAT